MKKVGCRTSTPFRARFLSCCDIKKFWEKSGTIRIGKITGSDSIFYNNYGESYSLRYLKTSPLLDPLQQVPGPSVYHLSNWRLALQRSIPFTSDTALSSDLDQRRLHSLRKDRSMAVLNEQHFIVCYGRKNLFTTEDHTRRKDVAYSKTAIVIASSDCIV